MAKTSFARYAQYLPYVRKVAKGGLQAYKGFKSVKSYQQTKLTGKGTQRAPEVDVNLNDAQQSIGYGQHDAKVIYGNRRRRSTKKRRNYKRQRKAVNRSLNKNQKKLVRRLAKGPVNAHFKTNTHMFQCLKSLDTNGQAAKQGFAGFVENTCYTGMFFPYDKANQISDIFNVNFLPTDTIGADVQEMEQYKRFKLKLVNSQTRYNIVCGAVCPNAQVDAHFFVCKKSMTYANLSGDEEAGIAKVYGGPLDDLKDFFDQKFNPPLLNRDGNNFTAIQEVTPGYDPKRDNTIFKEYFTFEKTERFQVSANANIVIENDHPLGITINAQTATKYAFLKGISRFVVFTVLGVPYVNLLGQYVDGAPIPPVLGGEAPQTIGSFGCVVRQYHRINHKAIYDSPDQADGDLKLHQTTSRGGVILQASSGGNTRLAM